jgi:hypothetical protein
VWKTKVVKDLREGRGDEISGCSCCVWREIDPVLYSANISGTIVCYRLTESDTLRHWAVACCLLAASPLPVSSESIACYRLAESNTLRHWTVACCILAASPLPATDWVKYVATLGSGVLSLCSESIACYRLAESNTLRHWAVACCLFAARPLFATDLLSQIRCDTGQWRAVSLQRDHSLLQTYWVKYVATLDSGERSLCSEFIVCYRLS